MKKSNFIVITLLSLLLISTFSAFASALYISEETTSVTIGSDRTFSGNAENIGVSYEILGTPGATGIITAQIYNGNPQSTASIPNGVSLSHFVVITINMNSADFSQAKIYITYTDADVATLQAPYAIYKYVASTDSFIEVPSTFDVEAKMATVTVTSIDDPLFAIGGASLPETIAPGFPATAWALLAASIVVIVLLVVVSVWYFKKRSQ